MNNYQWYTEQWGKPTREDDLLFLLLTVGVFQVGLSWKAAAGKKVRSEEHTSESSHNLTSRMPSSA